MATLDGVLQLDAVADELVHETFTCDTRDHEDHTFCGIMFDLACETERPVEYIEISSVHVRGALGPMTVWTTPGSFSGKHETEEAWTKVYSETHARSHDELVELRLQSPLRLKPGERLGLYVHSALPGDEGIVYDNRRRSISYHDPHFVVYSGMAHLSYRPFGTSGFWGTPWRQNREFVGRVSYGVRWKMWSPCVHAQFPLGFREAVRTVLMGSRRTESLLYLLQDEIILFTFNKIWWNEWGTQMAVSSTGAAAPSAPPAASASSSPSSFPHGHSFFGHPFLFFGAGGGSSSGGCGSSSAARGSHASSVHRLLGDCDEEEEKDEMSEEEEEAGWARWAELGDDEEEEEDE
mmetsp:Transcript_39932/g.125245  ORF Transcript_39932/g.125245 Transcript_39932/m.125245 type:complete len:350 (-) Transcript_39932:144-1193(-)